MAIAAVPSSSGPLSQLAELLISGPEAARAGELLLAVVTVRTRTAGPRMITTPTTSALLVVSGDRVVARQDGPARAGAVPLIVRAGGVAPAQAVPSRVRLVSSEGGTPLPPGEYALIAVLGYRNDSLNTAVDGGLPPSTGSRGFVLVSAPLPIEVRAH